MLLFASYENLREWGSHAGQATALLSATRSVSGKNTFLSHSSLDNELVAGALLILEKHGAHVYVDRQDPELDPNNCIEIARRLRGVIREVRKMVVLATPRSKDSKWIPWELGLGDGQLRESNVAIFPGAEHTFDTDWAEREYFGLYNRIVWGDHESYTEKIWMVLDFRTKAAVELSNWLRS